MGVQVSDDGHGVGAGGENLTGPITGDTPDGDQRAAGLVAACGQGGQ